MEHLEFILWMILFPISVSICGYIDALKNKVKRTEVVYSKDVEGYAGLVMVIIWLFVGYKLF